MKPATFASILLLVAACAGDGETTPRSPPVSTRLVTDSSTYSLSFDDPGWTATIGFSYRAGADTVYIVNCNGEVLLHLQRREADGWRDAWFAEGNQCLSEPLVIPPGELFRAAGLIWGAPAGTPGYNDFLVDELEGEFRLVWPQPVLNYRAPGATGTFGDTLPLADRVSNTFTLRTRPPSAPVRRPAGTRE